jgi:trehalose synthase-fused probable maltokinase
MPRSEPYDPPRVVAAAARSSLLSRAALSPLASQIFPPWLAHQRWFGARTHPITAVTVFESIPLPSEIQLAIVLLDIAFGSAPHRICPVVTAVDERGELSRGDCIAYLDLPHQSVALYEAFNSLEACKALLHLLTHDPCPPSPALSRDVTPEAAALPAPSSVRPMGVEQTHSSLVLDEATVLKLYRNIEAGTNPDVELCRFLTLRTTFADVPRYLGSLHHLAGDDSRCLAVLQQYVPNQGDGWHEGMHAATRALSSPSVDPLTQFDPCMRELGTTTARMHLALASDPVDPWFAPEPIEPDDLLSWREAMCCRSRSVRQLLQPSGGSLEPWASRIDAEFDALASMKDCGFKVRHHGDYHLGQVLRADGRWVVLDFEGEPIRTLSERREKHSALRDVAGMLRSLDYAAHAALQRQTPLGSPQYAPLLARALAWAAHARGCFLDAYLSAMTGSELLPKHPEQLQRLIDVFELDKAIYEVEYELRHRPDWLPIPLRGIEQILSKHM